MFTASIIFHAISQALLITSTICSKYKNFIITNSTCTCSALIPDIENSSALRKIHNVIERIHFLDKLVQQNVQTD